MTARTQHIFPILCLLVVFPGPVDATEDITSEMFSSGAVIDGECADVGFYISGTIQFKANSDVEVIGVFHSTDALCLCVHLVRETPHPVVRLAIDPSMNVSDATYQERSTLVVLTKSGASAVDRFDQWPPLEGGVDIPGAQVAFRGRYVEARIPLEVFGGRARRIGLLASVMVGDKEHRWPSLANPLDRSTWGAVALQPLVEPASASSTYVEGDGGFLAVPRSVTASLHIPLTLEGWVAVEPEFCQHVAGTASGDISLGACGVPFAKMAGFERIEGKHPLSAGWHHLALTVDRETALLYVDGFIVARSKPHSTRLESAATATPLRLGWSTKPPTLQRIPSRGWVRGVRIWSRVRTAEELHATLLVPILAPMAGLIASWPLTGTLLETAKRADAGFVGAAAFSVLEPQAARMPPAAGIAPSISSAPVALRGPQPWDGQLQVHVGSSRIITVDGICMTREYGGPVLTDAHPDGPLLRLRMDRNALFVCLGPLVQEERLHDASVRVWLITDSGEQSITISGDGIISPTGFNAQVFSADKLPVQENKPLPLQWWSAELHAPIADQLRGFAVEWIRTSGAEAKSIPRGFSASRAAETAIQVRVGSEIPARRSESSAPESTRTVFAEE